jgi:hypothetical protein
MKLPFVPRDRLEELERYCSALIKENQTLKDTLTSRDQEKPRAEGKPSQTRGRSGRPRITAELCRCSLTQVRQFQKNEG